MQLLRLRDMPRYGVIPWGSLFKSDGFLISALSFMLVAAALYGAFAWINVGMFNRVLSPRIQARRARLLALFLQLIVFTLLVLAFNSWHYSSSNSGQIFVGLIVRPFWQVILIVMATAVAVYFMIWCVMLWRQSRWFGRCVLGASAFVVLAGVGLSGPRQPALRDADGQFPDVIVIGIDSLRVDHLGISEGPISVTPNLDEWLSKSLVFSDSLSAQPHTFPATMSVLTGKWPVSHGARGNLFPPKLIDSKASIVHDFSQAGYATIMATDETRFANIDERYGFDKVVGPPMGVVDFLMSGFGDYSFVNIAVNLPGLRRLFPYIHANRAIDTTYRPGLFSARIENSLDSLDGRPLFLYAHLCVGHWPYRKSSSIDPKKIDSMMTGEYSDTNARYLHALAEADMQFGRLIDGLRMRGRLDNAVVVVLSDHGEDFNMDKDRMFDREGRSPAPHVYGHGGSAIRASQVEVLISLRRLGGVNLPVETRKIPASLIDIAPTLRQLVRLPNGRGAYDGLDLLDDDVNKSRRIRFVESSYLPNSLNKLAIDAIEVANESAVMYELVPNGRLQVKGEYIDFQIRFRQRAAYLDDWVVAMLPSPVEQTIVANRVTGLWRRVDVGEESTEVVEDLVRAICEHWIMDGDFSKDCGEVKYPSRGG